MSRIVRRKNGLIILSTALAMWGGPLAAESVVRGKILEKGVLQPFSDVAVFILPEKTRCITNKAGEFQGRVPDGDHWIVVNIPGYIKTEFDFASPVEGTLNVLVEKSAYNPYETTVKTKASTVQTSQKNLTAGEASKIAGTGGDTVKAVQTLPGVARVGSAQVVIRGSAPSDTRYLIDGHETPIMFHFGGLASVVNTDLLDEVIYLPGGYGAPYGRANGGIIGTTLRDARSDRRQGYVFADLINAGFLVEGPLGEGWSMGLTARRSYIGDVLKVLAKNNSSFDLTVAPYYYDGLITATKKISATKSVRFSLLGSYDELSFLIKEPRDADPAIRGTINDQTKFYRLMGTYTDHFSEDDVFRFSVAAGPDFDHVDVSELYFDRSSMVYSMRGDWEHRHDARRSTRLGIDNRYSQDTVKFKVPSAFSSSITAGNLVESSTQLSQAATGVFAEHKAGVLEDAEKWTWTPGIRYDRFEVSKENLFSPRLATRYALNETWALRASSGIYRQPPEPQNTDAVYGNTQIHSPIASHYVFGVEADPHLNSFNSLTVESDVFYKDLRDLIIADPVSRYSNNGTGRIYGAELFVKFLKDQWSGWLSYTFSKSRRSAPDRPEYDFDYDQTHNANLVLNYKTQSRWEFGARLRYVTGNPKTPIVASRFDADNDNYVGESGDKNSVRLPAFFQLDLRADKRWVYDTWILNLYLDLQNATNAKNVEGISYNYDYSGSQYATGLPIIPSFGIRAEF